MKINKIKIWLSIRKLDADYTDVRYIVLHVFTLLQ